MLISSDIAINANIFAARTARISGVKGTKPAQNQPHSPNSPLFSPAGDRAAAKHTKTVKKHTHVVISGDATDEVTHKTMQAFKATESLLTINLHPRAENGFSFLV